ncbi:MAG: lipoate--protein ligase [Candidatus Cryptobacteroides sp.]
MIHIKLTDNSQRRLVYYLAMEEYIAKETSLKEAFFLWQVPPTVIFGRNQVMEAEVNMGWCRENSVQVYRRKSGGGCVYSDRGNVMISYITDGEGVSDVFRYCLEKLSEVLRSFGVNAAPSGRNDIMIDGRKVSGNAFWQLPGRAIVHGTLLYDTDFEAMQKSITPSESKIRSKGVNSVRQHVVNLREVLPESAGIADVEQLKARLTEAFATSEYVLSPDEEARVAEIEKTYLDEDFFRGANRKYSVERGGKIEGVGEFVVNIDLCDNLITSVDLRGDFFASGLTQDVSATLTAWLEGSPLEEESFRRRLLNADLPSLIQGLETEDFVCLVFPDKNN